MNRRSFLSALALAAAGKPGLTSPGADPDVAIVGAGMAGISAAHAVRAGGRTVTLLEALPRIGGRAYTDRTTLGVPFDRGAAYLESASGNPLTEMAKRFAFTTSPHSPEERLYNGTQPAPERDQQAFEKAYEKLGLALEDAAEELDADVSAQAAVEALLAEDPWAPTAAAALTLDDGADINELSLRDWHGRTGGEPYLAVREGIGTLAQRIADGLPVSVGTIVSSIERTRAGFDIATSRGRIRAKAVIVTVSPAVLASGAIRFTPGLPQAISAAAAGLSMGFLEKTAFAMGPSSPLPQEETIVMQKTVPNRAHYLHVRPHGYPVALHYTGGSYAKALTVAGPQAAIAAAHEALIAAFGAAALTGLSAGATTGWSVNPRFLGAYACARPGEASARLALAKPFDDRLWLAGEALETTRGQTLDGAWLSGEKAAIAVLKRLRRAN